MNTVLTGSPPTITESKDEVFGNSTDESAQPLTRSAPVATVNPSVVPANADLFFETLDRFNQTLNELESLSNQLLDSSHAIKPVRKKVEYVYPPLSFAPPAGFLLTIVIPAYNESRTIEDVLDRVFALPIDKEVIVVDDCSMDGTARLLRSMLDRPGLRVIFKERNRGKGAALRDGFAAAKGDIVVVQDADREYDPRDIPKLLEAILLDGADVAFGSRYLDGCHDSSTVHRLGNALLTGTSNFLTGLTITDMETCYKAFKRRVIQSIPLRQNRFGFEPEITAKIARRGLRIREVPIGYNARSYAEGKKIGLKDIFNAFYCMVRYAVAD